MKFLWALAFLAVVCAIPRHRQFVASGETPVQLQIVQERPEPGNNQVEQGISPFEHSPPEPDNSEDAHDYEDYDDNDSEQEPSLVDLVNALHSIREAIRQKILNKLGHENEDSDDDTHVLFGRGPVDEGSANDDGAQAGSSSQPQSNSQSSGQIPHVNITQIKKEIHDKIDDIIANILRPWLGNNSAGGNESAPAPPQQANETANDNGQNSNNSAPDAPLPQPDNSNQPEPPSKNTSNETEQNSESEDAIAAPNVPEESNGIDDSNSTETPNDQDENHSSSNDTDPTVIDNEISEVIPAEHSQENIASESQVKIVLE